MLKFIGKIDSTKLEVSTLALSTLGDSWSTLDWLISIGCIDNKAMQFIMCAQVFDIVHTMVVTVCLVIYMEQTRDEEMLCVGVQK